MPAIATNPQMPDAPQEASAAPNWISTFLQMFVRLYTTLAYTLNALCKVDTIANRTSTPALDEIFFVASDTYQLYVGSSGVWVAVGRVGGTVMGAMPFTEISDADAPAADGARLYARDNGAGKTQLVVRFNSGAIQVLATEP